MSLFWVLILGFLLITSAINAQTGTPPTEVEPPQRTYVHGSLENEQIIIYAIYDPTTYQIQSYVLWNNTQQRASADLDMATIPDLSFTAQPKKGKSRNVRGKDLYMTLHPETGTTYQDLNVVGVTMKQIDPRSRFRLVPAPFPLPSRQ